jgi:hypothetical protein
VEFGSHDAILDRGIVERELARGRVRFGVEPNEVETGVIGRERSPSQIDRAGGCPSGSQDVRRDTSLARESRYP